MIKTRNIERDDFDFAIDVADKEGWEYERRDLERLAQVFPDGLFLAEERGRKLGWMIACHYGLFMWIGSLVVHSVARRRGVGSALMQRAFKYANENGARTVALYAYQKAIPFYARIGLRRNGEFLLLRGASEGEKQRALDLEKPEIDEILSLDRKYFRGDRLRLLEALREEFGQLFLLSKDKKSGYIFGKTYGDGSAEIGPWVCEPNNREIAESLLRVILSRIRSKRISVVVPALNTEALRILDKFSFKVQRVSTCMYRGSVEDLPRTDGIYAAAGWDVG